MACASDWRTHSTSSQNMMAGDNLGLRLQTFDRWTGATDKVQLARAGFTYTGIADKVECKECRIRLSNWQKDEDPLQAHQNYSPDCGFMKRNFPYSVYSEYEARLRSFDAWPYRYVPQSPRDLARAGFFYLGSADRVRCFHCGVTLKNWEEDDEPLQEHRKYAPDCGFMKNNFPGIRGPLEHKTKDQVKYPGETTFPQSPVYYVAMAGHSYYDSPRLDFLLGQLVPMNSQTWPKRPVEIGYPDYSNYDTRLRSFDSLPSKYISQTPGDMAKAGFFYIGYADRVRCFHCGVTLRDWGGKDEPLQQHYKYAPDCDFLRKNVSAVRGSSERKPRNQAEHPEYSDYFSRLRSFDTWPLTTVPQSPKYMARAGFFYVGSSDRVQCYHCGVTLRGWGQDNEPLQEHHNYAPGCGFMKNNFPGIRGPLEHKTKAEVKYPENSIYMSRLRSHEAWPLTNFPQSPEYMATAGNLDYKSPRLDIVLDQSLLMNSQTLPKRPVEIGYPDYSGYEARLRTFKNWPSKHISQSPQDMARAGFFYIGSADGVQCFHCGVTLRNWRQGDDPLREHYKYAPDCDFMRKKFPGTRGHLKQKTSNQVKYPEYSDYITRVRSFDAWPLTTVPQCPEYMARAGFFYIGSADHARCFHCGVTLRDWETDDYPPSAHKRWSNTCPFIQQLDVEEFRQEIEEARRQKRLIVQQRVGGKRGVSTTELGASSPDLESSFGRQGSRPERCDLIVLQKRMTDTLNTLKRQKRQHPVHTEERQSLIDEFDSNPAVLACIEMGTRKEDIKRVIEERRRQGLGDFPNAPSILMALEDSQNFH